MAKNSRGTKPDDIKSETKAEPERAARAAEPFAPPEMVQTPVQEDQLRRPDEGDAIPEMDISEDPPSDGISESGFEIDDLTVEREVDAPLVGLDEGFDPDDLEQFLDNVAGAGGADGRNPANDGGGPRQPDGELPDGFDNPIGGNPNSGLDGAAGKLPPHQQAYLNDLKERADAAAVEKNFEKIDAIAKETENYLVEIGVHEPRSDEVKNTESDYDLISTLGAGTGGKQQVWDNEKGEVVMVEPGTTTNHEQMGRMYEQYRETGTNASGDQDTPSPPVESGLNEDREVEDDLPDQTPELTELYGGLKMDDVLGGDIDDNPNDDSTGATQDGPPPSADPTDLVANYGSDHNETEADASRVSAEDAIPDEEFFEP